MKKLPSDLAINGGKPLFEDVLCVGRPNICDREGLFRRMNEAVDRGWLTNGGPLVVEMEERFAQFLDVKHCIAVANATLGLQLVAHALDLKGEVIMPSFTFIGTARAMEWRGLKPRFVDVLDARHSIDPEAVRNAINPNVSAILGVHLWGMPCEIEELQAIADTHGIPLFFDAAHALGSVYRGKRIGGFGRAEVFSLHATKAINGLEGGLVTTNDDEMAHRIRLARNYGIADEDVFEGTGINAKMNEFSAAMALSNLEGYEALLLHNRVLQQSYLASVDDVPGIDVVTAHLPAEHNSHYAVLRLSSSCPITRDRLRDVLIAENIYPRRYFRPGCHRCPPCLDAAQPALPITERLSEELLQLPTGLQLTADDVANIGQLITFVCQMVTADVIAQPG